MSVSKSNSAGGSIVAISREKGLDSALLYETVIELSNEGLLTAGGLNSAAGILLTQLGLPEYFFRNISKDALKRVLRAIAGNLQFHDGEYVLRSEVSEARLDVDGGVQARIATPENRDRMEAVLNPVMAGNRIEYYFGRERQYYTYIIRPERCKEWRDLAEGESPFAFNQIAAGPPIPEPTRKRYDAFLRRCNRSVVPLIEVTYSEATRETRVMFKEDFNRSILPVVRRMLSDLGITLNRAYWETYRTPVNRLESVCSLYLGGKPRRAALAKALKRLHALISIQASDFDDLFTGGTLTFEEYVFTTVAASFVHTFIHRHIPADRDIMDGLSRKELRDAMARRVFDSDRAEFTRSGILNTVRERPELLKRLYRLFDRKFNPRRRSRADLKAIAGELDDFRRRTAILFVDDRTGGDVFEFMTRLITHVQKTNFYKVRKRSCAFRLDPAVLDPLIFPGRVYGVFFVVGFYAAGTHMRADDVARGGIRLIRVTRSNYENELDYMPLLNYALGPVAQRLKHKDIAESGAKGVIVPAAEYARDGLSATLDFTEGIMDLIQPCEEVADYFGKPEMVFFGPDEGTASFMDAVALRGRERGYKHWRTLTTGKSIGIPHDTYGLTKDRRVFGLVPHGDEGTELQIEGAPPLRTRDMQRIYDRIGDRIDASGMTTMGVMACLRILLENVGLKEADVGLMMTGGPDGDLGANQIQSFRGRICLVLDGGSVLFDPDGLDRAELMKIAFARHTHPRLNSLAYPQDRLSRRGFRVPRASGSFKLPDGTTVEDGAYFHRNVLTNPAMRPWFAKADIQAFVPCGGLKDTVNAGNVRAFLGNFRELRLIVEGANVFFDDTAREVIARESPILQIKDSSANKGGVTSSSVAEVLTAFLLGDDYEKTLVQNQRFRADLIRAVFDLIAQNAAAETRMLLALRAKSGEPLYTLSVQTSEKLLALQDRLYEKLPMILRHREMVAAAMRAYIPRVLLDRLGMPRVLQIFGAPELHAYRDAMLTKKLAALALYRHAQDWDAFTALLDREPLKALARLLPLESAPALVR